VEFRKRHRPGDNWLLKSGRRSNQLIDDRFALTGFGKIRLGSF